MSGLEDREHLGEGREGREGRDFLSAQLELHLHLLALPYSLPQSLPQSLLSSLPPDELKHEKETDCRRPFRHRLYLPLLFLPLSLLCLWWYLTQL